MQQTVLKVAGEVRRGVRPLTWGCLWSHQQGTPQGEEGVRGLLQRHPSQLLLHLGTAKILPRQQ